MGTLTVITAASTTGMDHIGATVSSLRAQSLPDGWDLEWCVQLDGDPVSAPQVDWPVFARVEAHGQRLGPAAARNLALARCTGRLVCSLDADDQLTPGALAGLVAPFAYPHVGWSVGRAADLLVDGTVVEFEMPFAGQVGPGEPSRWWREHGYILPFHTVGFCARRSLVEAVGGWAGLPAGEDTAMMLAVCELSPGVAIGATTVLYRKWADQLTAGDAYRRLAPPSHVFVDRRLAALSHILTRP